ncbi:MAG: hypothetical protein R3C17_06115 [Planctomycetaceae bacterium]
MTSNTSMYAVEQVRRKDLGKYELILDRSERLSGKRPLYELIDESKLVLTIYAAEVEPNGRSKVSGSE